MSPKPAILLMFALLAVPLSAATRMTYDIQGNSIPIQWEPTAFPLRYEIDTRLAGRAELIDRAFQAWQGVSGADVRFERGAIVTNGESRNDGKVVVSMADSLFANQGAFAMTT
ncbi:MAG TPA: hypothetical protein VF111_13510, partial [Thermoanaerobaculia bacterium]